MANALAERIENIKKTVGISGREVAQLLNTRPETVSRWRVGKAVPQPKPREDLLHLWWLTVQLAELYHPKEANLWLFSPNERLNGEHPVDLIQRGEIERVLKVIDQLKDGAYV
jgi:transcriptional regulator with XRE-family HTH domain